jgi:regulator of replication initiation timing
MNKVEMDTLKMSLQIAGAGDSFLVNYIDILISDNEKLQVENDNLQRKVREHDFERCPACFLAGIDQERNSKC